MKSTVCVFIKAPIPGQAKTRLSPVFGAGGAALFAQALLEDALERWNDSSLLIAHTGEFSARLWKKLETQPRVSQGDGDLGMRMETVARHALVESDAAMIVGTDIPGLGERDAEEARIALQDHDAVLGPCRDGGFYLLGLKSCPEGFLREVPWSSSQTLAETRARLVAAGMSVALLHERFDVDMPEDLGALRAFLRENPRQYPRVRGFLESRENRSISVVIPVLNESSRLGEQLDSLLEMDGISQIIVADGGSSDGSLAIAQARPGVTVVRSARGRAVQMNAGADAAFGGTLLFVHADARLPHDACQQIHAVFDSGDAQAGAFRLKTFYDPKGRHRPWITPLLRLADMRSAYTRYPYGDQALFVRTSTFRAMGGYPRLPLFEDLAFTMAMHRLAPLARARGPVRVSGRRFQQRPLYYLALMNSFPLLYRLGVPAESLARFYRDTR